jgi:hypothetical protein
MIETLPPLINWLFIGTTLLTLWFLLKATPNYKPVLIISLVWLIVQGAAGYSGFYTVTDSTPPRFAFLIIPPLLTIAGFFLTTKGRLFIDSLEVKWLTYLHVVRIPVEITLLLLFMNKQVPELMTFEGRNFDILSGLTAPIIAWFRYKRCTLSKTLFLAWNFICLALLINIVVNAVLSAPLPFQQFAFDQPNVALLHFPFGWLPCFIVPVVLFSHLVAIRRAIKSTD